MRIVRTKACLVVCGLLVATACAPEVSDTGYMGTWTRQGLGSNTTIAIVEQGDEYLFRWGRDSEDGKLHVRCDWAGNCEEAFDGEINATYRMRTWIDEESGLLRVECKGVRWGGTDDEKQVHYVDELIIRRDGTRLVSREVVKDGVELEGRGRGRRVFEKYSDKVVNPPGTSGGRD